MKWRALKWLEESTHDGIYKQAGGGEARRVLSPRFALLQSMSERNSCLTVYFICRSIRSSGLFSYDEVNLVGRSMSDGCKMR